VAGSSFSLGVAGKGCSGAQGGGPWSEMRLKLIGAFPPESINISNTTINDFKATT